MYESKVIKARAFRGKKKKKKFSCFKLLYTTVPALQNIFPIEIYSTLRLFLCVCNKVIHIFE